MTQDIGNPALKQHLFGLIVLMRASRTWEEFKQRVDDALPRCGETLKLPFMAKPILIAESSSSDSEK
jgi:hypothetical protein